MKKPPYHDHDVRNEWNRYYSSLNDPNAEVFKAEFDRYTYTHSWANSIRIIRMLTTIKDGDTVLDAGGGWGRLLLGILDQHSALNVTVVDYQSKALEIGKALMGNRQSNNSVKWEVGNIENLSFRDNSFDVVYSGRVFQHLTNPEKGASEIIRVLKPGGTFVIFLQNKLCPANFAYYARLYTPMQVKRWFRNKNLSALHVRSMDFCPSFIGSMWIERSLERVPVLNYCGGKVVLWGRKKIIVSE